MNSAAAPSVTSPARGDGVRGLHLVDLENLLGAHRDLSTTRWVWQRYAASGVLKPGDQVVVATGPAFAAAAWFALPTIGVRRLVRSGVDGADLALLDETDPRWVARRYGRLVISSGDHVFALLARQAALAGMQVTNVTGYGRPSPTLARQCQQSLNLLIPTPVAFPATTS